MDEKAKNSKPSKLLAMWKQDDPLYFLIYPLHFGMEKHIFLINAIKFLIILYLQIFNVIGIIYISKDIRTYLRPYISGILIQQVGISSYALMMYYTRDILHLSHSVGQFFLPFDAIGKKVNEEILHQHALIRRFFPMFFISLTTVYCGFLPGMSSLENYQFTVVFIKENFGSWSYLFQGLYYLCILSSGYSIGSLCCVSIYLAMHITFQLHLLASHLQQVSHGIEPNNEDTLYQDVIQERLRSFVKAHVKIIQLSRKFLAIGEWSVLVTMIANSFLYTALVNFLAMNTSAMSNLICSVGLIVAVVVSYFVAAGGQKLQDESTNLYNAACQCKWSDWNIQNRRTLQMIMISTSKTIKITSFGLFDLGNVIILRMLKLTYSLVLLFVNVNK